MRQIERPYDTRNRAALNVRIKSNNTEDCLKSLYSGETVIISPLSKACFRHQCLHHLHHGPLCHTHQPTQRKWVFLCCLLQFICWHSKSAFMICHSLSSIWTPAEVGVGSPLPSGPARPSQLRLCRSCLTARPRRSPWRMDPEHGVSVLRCDAAQTVSPVCDTLSHWLICFEMSM